MSNAIGFGLYGSLCEPSKVLFVFPKTFCGPTKVFTELPKTFGEAEKVLSELPKTFCVSPKVLFVSRELMERARSERWEMTDER